MNEVPQAFDIPLSKTNKTPPVAKRLANSPQNGSPTSLEEIKGGDNVIRESYGTNAEKERVKRGT